MYQKVMESWPGDNRSLLRLGNLEFEDEIFRPELLEFDIWSFGRYDGLAMDVLYARWETFALVMHNC